MGRCPLCLSESTTGHACVYELPIRIGAPAPAPREEPAPLVIADTETRAALEALHAAVCERGLFCKRSNGLLRCTFCSGSGAGGASIWHRPGCAFARAALLLGHFAIVTEQQPGDEPPPG